MSNKVCINLLIRECCGAQVQWHGAELGFDTRICISVKRVSSSMYTQSQTAKE